MDGDYCGFANLIWSRLSSGIVQVADRDALVEVYLLLLVFLITVLGLLGYMPIRLKAGRDKIAVSRLFGALEIPLSEVTSVVPIPKSYIDGSIRTFGSGGAFGYLGRFKNKTLGRYTMYATELKHLVLVRTRQKKYVFSCTRPEEFMAYVQARLKQ